MRTHSNSAISTNTVTFPANLPSTGFPVLSASQLRREKRGVQPVAGGQHSRRGAQLPGGRPGCLSWHGLALTRRPSPCLAQQPPSAVDVAEQRCLSWDITYRLTQECSWVSVCSALDELRALGLETVPEWGWQWWAMPEERWEK